MPGAYGFSSSAVRALKQSSENQQALPKDIAARRA
jgi:hypothetical protein